MKTVQRITMLMLALIASLSVNAIDIKIKKDKTVVDGIFYNVNLNKL